MLTAGIDLGAEPDRTARAVVLWRDEAAEVIEAAVGVDDGEIVDTVRRAAKTGIDCPFGWPERFIDLVVAHRNADLTVPASADRSWRRSLVLRVTDEHVRAVTGLTPLSVAADRIGHVALRCAALLAVLRSLGVDCPRDGSGRVAEVYPAAALQRWGLAHRGYKRAVNTSARNRLVDELAVHSWLTLGAAEATCRSSDDALDAVLSALVARAVAVNATEVPPSDLVASARTEGWIHLPRGPVDHLATTSEPGTDAPA